MKAAVLVGFRKPLEIGQQPDPTPGPEDAVIRVEAVGVCRSDWHAWRGDWSWLGLTPKLPIIPGHEFAGVVEAVGSGVKRLKPGTRVTVPFHQGCGTCPYCLSGTSNLCDAMSIFGFGSNGGFAEFVRVPLADHNAVPLPEGVDSLSASALGCRYMTSYRAVVTKAAVRPGEWVVVHGAGGVGLAALQIAKAMGAQVVMVDPDPAKLAMAKAEGATGTVQAGKDVVLESVRDLTGGGAHVSIEAVGIATTVLNSVLSLRKGGRHVQVGLTTDAEQGMVALPIDAIVAMELQLLGSLGNPHADYPNLLRMVASGGLQPTRLVSAQVGLNDLNGVLEAMTTYGTQGFHVITRF